MVESYRKCAGVTGTIEFVVLSIEATGRSIYFVQLADLLYFVQLVAFFCRYECRGQGEQETEGEEEGG